MKTVSLFLANLISLSVFSQTITTVAGDGNTGYTGDGGIATAAAIGFPGFLSFDKFDNYYIEELNNTIRKVSSSGIISTIAGNGTAGFSGDYGPATNAQLNFTGGGGIACDNSGNIYVADQANNRIRKISIVTGAISTIAGDGSSGFSGDNGPATAAGLNSPVALAFDASDNLYIVDGFNNRIRKIDNAGKITTIAGTGISGYSGDGGPATLAKINTSGNIHVADNILYQADGFRVRKINLASNIITTIAGTGIQGFSGDNGPATAAQLYLCIDAILGDGGNLFISDMDNNRIRLVNASGFITTLVGNGIGTFSGDNGPASNAKINSPRGIALDSCGNLYIADNGNNRIRKISYPNCHFLNIEIESGNQNMSIYPNPCSSELNVNNVRATTKYIISNITGIIEQKKWLRNKHLAD